MKTTRRVLLFLMLPLSLLGPCNLYASTVLYEFTAVVDSIAGQYGQVDIVTGQTISGWFRYDDAVLDTFTSGLYHETFGNYSQDASMSLVLGSQSVTCLNGPTSITIHNAGTLHPSDDDSFKFFTNRVAIQEAGDYADLSIELYDLTKTVFDSDALPALMELSAFATAQFCCGIAPGPNQNYYFRTSGHLTSLTQVPEPATVSLLGFG